MGRSGYGGKALGEDRRKGEHGHRLMKTQNTVLLVRSRKVAARGSEDSILSQKEAPKIVPLSAPAANALAADVAEDAVECHHRPSARVGRYKRTTCAPRRCCRVPVHTSTWQPPWHASHRLYLLWNGWD